MSRPTLTCLCVLFICLGAASTATAQENPTVETSQSKAQISELQTKLNDEAVSAIIRGEPERAVALLNESLAYGEANITYLNLGRAYQKLDKCAEAREAYAKVATAPAVEEPPATVVLQKTEEYLAELDEQDCKGGVQLAQPPAEVGTDGQKTWGWAAIGTGAAFLGAGVTMFVLSNNEASKVEDARTDGRVVDFPAREVPEVERRASLYLNLGIGASVAGAALTGVGAYLLLDDDGEQVGRLDVRPVSQGAMATFHLSF
ncbi:hypothetical protein FIV42_26715 [Persicimonas caeni]|uniref:Tetratricopeptide repeat protein n=1 Tax=Persicimonas caeni TaxID=2292766 RepID=A0A4Y6Q2I3_PERCE|nr:hypothetical protein [Persicimonas caeni]QDG54205.1 hypothetical protein FIV42_26715 [Persicimonas caeni]QED35426.1 hypothetical protein FRD00_26710 [Persicimonas caeni]